MVQHYSYCVYCYSNTARFSDKGLANVLEVKYFLKVCLVQCRPLNIEQWTWVEVRQWAQPHSGAPIKTRVSSIHSYVP